MLTFPPKFTPEKRIKFETYKKKIKITEKKIKNRKGKKSKTKKITLNNILPKLTIKLTFFNPIFIFKNLIFFNIFRDIYHSLAIFVNELIKLF